MAVILSSIFRDAADYVDRWYAQVKSLESLLDEPIRLMVAEGDSSDATYALLASVLDTTDRLIKAEHGGATYGPVDRPERWRQIAYVCNAVLDEVQAEIGPDDRWIYVESDLVWAPDAMLRLLEDLTRYHLPAVAAMSMRGWDPERFYDIWGHVGLDGVPFTPDAPYHSTLAGPVDLVRISSAGSCWAARASATKAMRFSPVDCVRGIGRSLREAGYSLWLDLAAVVLHPPR